MLKAAAAFAIAGLLHGQAQGPTFEVVSIKASKSAPAMGRDAGRISFKGISLRALVLSSYRVLSSQLTAPDWLAESRYDVEVTMPPNTSPEQERLMWQAMLADRFKLQVHREKREIPAYVLSVGKNGPKLAEPTQKEGRIGMGGPGKIMAANATMAGLAAILSMRLDRQVVDETGLAGNYSFTLQWAATPQVDGPPVFGAVQEQLGLKLEARKATVEFVVVDHAERPTEN
jgi:uncharacterized protein (TIGR03435 family)